MINRLAMHQEWFDKNQNMMFLESRIVMQELLAMCRQYKAERVEAADEIDAAIKQSEDTRRWLRDACAEIARIETRFYDAVTPQQIAERNGWDCFK